MNHKLKFYTYINASPDGEVFYVGKGRGKRMYSTSDRSWEWFEVRDSYDGMLVKIVQRFETEQEAFEHEKYLIEFYRKSGANLVNRANGGIGPTGCTMTEARKKMLSEKLTGFVHEQVTCPNCGMVGGATTMKRWHFDNCKGLRPTFKARVTIDGVRRYLGKFHTKEAADARVAEELFKGE